MVMNENLRGRGMVSEEIMIKWGDKENSLGKNVGMDDKRKVRNNEKYNDKYWNNKKKDWMERK